MNDVTIKAERKRMLPVFIVSIIFSILFLSILIISIIYNLLGYTLYLLIILLILIIPIFLEFRWLNKINVTFTNSKLLLDILVIKKVTDKNKPKWYYPFKYRFNRGIITRYATIEKFEIKYNDITDHKINNSGDLEIITFNNKYIVKQSLYGYKPWVDQQFTKEQIFFMYDELKKKVVD